MVEDFEYSDSHEEYVSFETAKLLKQVGFKWPTNKAFDIKGNSAVRHLTNWNANDEYKDWCFAAPTLSVAQRWLREKKMCEVYVYMPDDYNTDYVYVINGVILDGASDLKKKKNGFGYYEKALEAGIKKCLILILEKGK